MKKGKSLVEKTLRWQTATHDEEHEQIAFSQQNEPQCSVKIDGEVAPIGFTTAAAVQAKDMRGTITLYAATAGSGETQPERERVV